MFSTAAVEKESEHVLGVAPPCCGVGITLSRPRSGPVIGKRLDGETVQGRACDAFFLQRAI